MDVTLNGVIVGDRLEKILASAIGAARVGTKASLKNIRFDLSKTEFLDCYSAQLLICYIVLFDRRGTLVSMELPRKKPVRDILRVWNFDDALKAASGRRMISFCEDSAREKYFVSTDRQSTFDIRLFPNQYQISSNIDEPESRVHRNNFFGFRTIDVPSDFQNKPEAANEEKKYWQNHNIKTLLESDLNIDVRYFSARIIFEAVFNALRHPSAEIVQTATHTRYIYEKSQLPLPFLDTQRTGSKDKKSAVIHYWDNGTSILDLINNSLAAGGTFRTAEAGEYKKTYLLIWRGVRDNASPVERIMTCDQNANNESHLSEKLLFVLQPYVSMSPSLFGHSSTEETAEDDPRLASIGMGLYLLLDTAVGMFNGKVGIRTANVRMRITRGKKKPAKSSPEIDYVVDIEQMPEELPKFLGNLISITIPEQVTKGSQKGRQYGM